MRRLTICVAILLTGFLSSFLMGQKRKSGVYENKPIVQQPKKIGGWGMWLMADNWERYYKSLFPHTSDNRINAVLNDPDLILYTDREIPLARQNWSNVSSGVHSILYDISGGADRIGRGSAHEFPWKDPAGTHNVPDRELVEVRGMLLPKKDGERLPIVYWNAKQDVHKDSFDARRQKIEWTYPRGTVFIELLARRLSNGRTVPFELRVRIREKGAWAVDVFRPYTNWKSLATRLKELGQEEEAYRVSYRPSIRNVTLHDGFHPNRQEIKLSGQVEQLPKYSDELVVALLKDRTFRSALGQSWRYDSESNVDVNAPAGGVYPAKYEAIMSVDRETCMNCHRSANRSVTHFDVRRDWYGNVRGSDQIISFHPFDPSCISKNGQNLRVKFRPELVGWRLLERYDRRKHPATLYTALKN